MGITAGMEKINGGECTLWAMGMLKIPINDAPKNEAKMMFKSNA